MLDTLEESPVMTEEQLIEVLSSFTQYLDERIVRPAVGEFRSAIEGLNPHKAQELLRNVRRIFSGSSSLNLNFCSSRLADPKG
jgi:hypothetical protein